MILALSLIQRLYEGYKTLNTPESQDVIDTRQRQKLACYAIHQLDKQGGFFLNVDAVRGMDEGDYSSDILVSLVFKVQTRQDQFADQHISYSVDTSSWKAMERDLTILGQHFDKANRRAYPEEDHPSEFLVTDYVEFLDYLKEKSQVELKL